MSPMGTVLKKRMRIPKVHTLTESILLRSTSTDSPVVYSLNGWQRGMGKGVMMFALLPGIKFSNYKIRGL